MRETHTASAQVPADLHAMVKQLADDAGMKIPPMYRIVLAAGLAAYNNGEVNDPLQRTHAAVPDTRPTADELA
jgi:hypothetical protein